MNAAWLWPRATLLLAVVALLMAAGRPPAGGAEWVERLRFPAPQRAADAESQVALARDLERAMRGAVGRERLALRLAAIEAWRALPRWHGPERSLAVDGARRAGRLLSGLGFFDEARDEFAYAAAAGAGETSLAATLELAHLERRGGRPAAALGHYLRLVREERVSPALRDEATLWAGRAHQDLGERAQARRLWRELAERAQDPVTRVRAHDWLALDHLAAGDDAGAAGWLMRCRETLFAASLERTPEGTRVRRALARMRASVELALAIEDRSFEWQPAGEVAPDGLLTELWAD